ncbi:MAG: TetR/AcrR family transcriptional regulator [Hyphomicrobiales bacterium]|nr:MAG: TetR/AcrR family transcriptional regulator [Hyphomicrobiales bacterium]
MSPDPLSQTPRPAERALRSPRLRPEERERLILRGAVSYFADVGFGGDLRELAKRLGITHSLLFRYFPTKDSLIERVYQEVFVGRWNPYWEIMIEDRTVPFRTRLVSFYKDYAKTILDREWIRIFMYAGLKGSNINERFLSMLRERILVPLCREMRYDLKLPSAEQVPITDFELELFVGNNSRIVYMAIRKWVYGLDLSIERADDILETTLDVFLTGVRPVLSAHFEAMALAKERPKS